MSATTEAQICNMSLQEIGDQTITALTDDSDRARLCALFYPQCRDYVLRSHPWKFAIKRSAVQKLADAPLDLGEGFSSQFQLPSDYLRLLDHDVPNKRMPFKIEMGPSGGYIIAINADTLNIKYVARVTDVSLFDPMFIEGLAAYLAHKLAIPIKADKELKKGMEELYRERISEAKHTGAVEDTSEAIIVSDIVDVRGGYMPGPYRDMFQLW